MSRSSATRATLEMKLEATLEVSLVVDTLGHVYLMHGAPQGGWSVRYVGNDRLRRTYVAARARAWSHGL